MSVTHAERAGAKAAYRTGFLLRKAHQMAVAIWFRDIDGIPLTPPQHNILSTVSANPGRHQTELARLVGYDRATVGAVLAGLEERGLIKRLGSKTDRRLKTLSITPRGTQLLTATAPVLERINRHIVEPLEPHERDMFLALLEKIAFMQVDEAEANAGAADVITG
jgi:MarR family transcriptional regulator, lower aerobic nicotinate degradation pathway regulator